MPATQTQTTAVLAALSSFVTGDTAQVTLIGLGSPRLTGLVQVRANAVVPCIFLQVGDKSYQVAQDLENPSNVIVHLVRGNKYTYKGTVATAVKL